MPLCCITSHNATQLKGPPGYSGAPDTELLAQLKVRKHPLRQAGIERNSQSANIRTQSTQPRAREKETFQDWPSTTM